MTSTLRTLALTILSGVDAIEAAYSQADIPVPSLYEPFVPSPLDRDNALVDAQRVVANAAAQLIAHARQPMDSIIEQSFSMYTTALLGFVVEAHIPDILKTVGPQGLAAKEIAVLARVDAGKLARVLRYLAARHIFTEVSPNVFANNRISSILAKTRSFEEIKSSPQVHELGVTSLVGHLADESLKSVPFISSFLLDPRGYASPFNAGIGSPATMWEWYTEPENVQRGLRFSASMKGSAARYTSETFTSAFDWAAIKDGSTVVDVGGGAGNVTVHLAKAFSHLNYVVQDLSSVITDTAEKVWAAECPEKIADGSVSLQVHDFFTEQPVKSAAAYYMRFVLHDWDDEKCIDIMRKLRVAAGPSSSLIVWERFVPYACDTTDFKAAAVLLPLTALDMHMMSMLDGEERMASELVRLGKAAGWKFEEKKVGQWLMTLVFSPE